jgi:outer membrane lipoprotein carrier protein
LSVKSKLLMLAWILPAMGIAQATATSVLDRYLDDLKTLRAEFTQTLVDARGREVESTSGTLVVSRPGKFRWDLGNQLLVADGKNVWFFDRDLEQVTVKPADAALSATPAMLLSGTTDLRSAFKVSSAGERDGLEWVLVEPTGAEADFRRALLGFSKGQLQRMIIDDKLGQTATVSFQKVIRNASVKPEEVSFTPPPGADVIGRPRE